MEFIPLAALALIFWFLIVQPQRRRSRRQAALVESLQPGEEVLTSAGFYGRIQAIEDDRIHLELAPGTVVRLDKRAVAARLEPENPR